MKNNNANWRVIIDTNLWVGFVIAGMEGSLRRVFEHPDIDVFSSVALRKEAFDIIQANRLRKYVRHGVLQKFLREFAQMTIEIEVKSTVFICRDVKDNFLLELSKDANADFLLSHDNDLLVLDPFGKTRIMRLPDFLQWLEKLT